MVTSLQRSPNGFLIKPDNRRVWAIDGCRSTIELTGGWGGFCLVAYATWFHHNIESLDAVTKWDEHGYYPRFIGGTTTWSTHASATGMDLQALDYPRGRWLMSTVKKARIRAKLRLTFEGLIVWGGEWKNPDEMHYELRSADDQQKLNLLGRQLTQLSVGQKVLRANPEFAEAKGY